MENTYSATWFELFLKPIDAAQTEREVAFISAQLPLASYASVLDICCGWGRHARALARRSYRVTGVDVDADAIAHAQQHNSAGVTYLQHDMRALDRLPGSFDAIMILWQSFGYFDAATNAAIIAQISRKLHVGGRLILDVYHRSFFAAHGGERSFERDGLRITERKRMQGQRLVVELDYGTARGADRFDWQLYTPDELCALGATYGLECVLTCANFDAQMPPASGNPRMQIVLERRRTNDERW